MIFRSYSVEGIIIKRVNIGEADKIITLFTRQKGKICCLAKGIRRIHSKRAGALELFNIVKAQINIGKSLDYIVEVEQKSCFPATKEFKKILGAYQVIELVDRLTAQNQENSDVYKLLEFALQKICRQEFMEADLLTFKKNLLVNLGFGLPHKNEFDSLDTYIKSLTNRQMISSIYCDTIS
jgi:DNA repair protein RecO (recombination protein O)